MSTADRFVQIRDAAKARGDHNFAAEAQAQLDRMGYQETPGDLDSDLADGTAPGSEDDSSGPGGGAGTSSTETMVPTAPVETVVPPKKAPGRKATRPKPNKPPKKKET